MGLGSYAGGAIHDLLGTYQWRFLGSFAIGSMADVPGVTLKAPVGGESALGRAQLRAAEGPFPVDRPGVPC
jgi:hypothetical protein